MRNLTNDMVRHTWAQQNQPYGESSTGNFSFDCKELISYGTTIALHYGSFVLLSADTFSPTTSSKHMSGIHRAVSCPVVTIDNIFSWGKRFNYRDSLPKGPEIKKQLIAEVVELATSYGRRKRDSTRAWDLERIESKLDGLRIVCHHFGLKYPAGYASAAEALGASAKEVEKIEKARKREEAKRKKAQAQERKEQEYNFNQWIEGDDLPSGPDGRRQLVSCPWVYARMDQAFLTVHGETVHTSQGAQAPLDHVKKAFKLYHRVRKAGEAWTKNGERARLGHFDLDAIDKHGNARAGCHTFKAEELERFYNKWLKHC